MDLLTAMVAVAGLVLGIVNFVTELVRRKPHAAASIRDCYAGNDPGGHVCAVIHVINTGEVPIYFEQFGLCIRGNKGFIHVKPQRIDGSEIPSDLLPGQAVNVVVDDEIWADAKADDVTYAFARISTGKEFRTERLERDAIARYRASAKKHLKTMEEFFHSYAALERL